MLPSGRVFDISRGCVDDGPGLRTVVFLKGCRLECAWCHNIEGKSFAPEIAFDAARCLGCGHCQQSCPRSWRDERPDGWREGCTACGSCAAECPSGARRLVGRSYEIEELMREIELDADFFAGTGGGVTFSGGEPVAQPEFLFACASALRSRGIHVALETAGLWPAVLVRPVAERFDLVLFDVKHVDEGRFQRALGRSSAPILHNLRSLLGSSVPMELRLTLVPGFNDGVDDLAAIETWLGDCARQPELTLLGLHRLAAAKQELLGKSYPYAAIRPMSKPQLEQAAELLRDRGLRVTVG